MELPTSRDPSALPSATGASSERLFRTLVEQVRDYAIFSTDANGTLASWNEGVAKVLGCPADEFVGHHVSMLMTPEDRAAGESERELRHAAEYGAASDDRWLQRCDGRRFWASGITTALRDDGGKLIGFSKVLRDLTDRKQAELAVRESEERLQMATAAAKLGTWDYDPTRDALMLDARSRSCMAIDPHVPATLDTFMKAVHPEHLSAVDAALRGALQPPGRFDVEFKVVPSIDPDRWLCATGRTYFNDTQAVRFIGTLQDITPRKRAEREREELLARAQAARADAEQANRLKDQFLGTLSHELRTPLNVILGYVQQLRAGYLDRGGVSRALAAIERNALAQKHLVEYILDISRIVHGGIRLEPVRLDARDVFNETVEDIAPRRDPNG